MTWLPTWLLMCMLVAALTACAKKHEDNKLGRNTMCLQVHKLSDTLYQFNESADFAGNGQFQPYVDAYLLIGKKRAALIDSLQNVTGLYAEARKLTDLPVDILVTHGHLDHVGASTPEFVEAGCKVYMVPEDFEILVEMMPGAKQDWFTELKDGDCFDLGGYTLETIACGGHSPGSVAFLEREHQLLFSGDTIGSGNFWMQVPTALPMAQFRDNVVRLTKKVEGLNDLLVYPGHRNQSPVQLTAQYVQDTCFIAEGIMDGSIVGDDQEMNFMGTQMKYKTVAHGQMVSFCYDPDRLQ